MPEEISRLQFIEKRDGITEAINFAKRTMVSYRRMVLSKRPKRSLRKSFIESYITFKKYIAQHRGNIKNG